ncbi:hypothetical protein [Aminobacter aminovorans]|uniref:hypothetical protein n=1 Tax=Aminobacter aminovorans TaxID=83263 RepID=UPI00285C3107|nr:hypothetical protein [Aminobacter aminovorans]MDR7219943.1 hypothetical protein [Aminobacter aminovorans]
MSEVTSSQQPVTDVWPYVDLINPNSIGVLAFRDVEYVYQDRSQQYDHVLIATEQADVFLVVIVDRSAKRVLGHRLLDLIAEYGLAHKHRWQRSCLPARSASHGFDPLGQRQKGGDCRTNLGTVSLPTGC